MKSIAIVGAGIGGCTTYLFLKKHLAPAIPDLSIHIYESYPPPPYLSSSHPATSKDTLDPTERPNQRSEANTDVTTALGGGLGLSPNGIRVLESLDPAISRQLKAVSIEVESFTMQLPSGRSLGEFRAGGKRYGHGTLLVMRAAVHDAVLKRVDTNDISFRKKVAKVVDAEEAAQIEFEDGTKVEVDLVIGADGVWGETRMRIPESAGLKPEYDGLVGVGAFFDKTTTRQMIAEAESKKTVIPQAAMTMTFGNGSFVGTILDKNRLDEKTIDGESPKTGDADRDPPCAGYWVTFPMEPAPSSRTPFSGIKEQLLAQHKSWAGLVPVMIENSGLQGSKGTSILPRWITPSLPRWTGHNGRVILVGDAAHCMPPDSGQGVSCAVEDAMTIGLLCEAIFAPSVIPESQPGEEITEQEKLKRLCDLYTKVRKPRCDYVVAEARKRGNMKRELSWWEEMVRNFAIWTMCKILPESANDAIYSWDTQTEVKKALESELPAFKGTGAIA